MWVAIGRLIADPVSTDLGTVIDPKRWTLRPDWEQRRLYPYRKLYDAKSLET